MCSHRFRTWLGLTICAIVAGRDAFHYNELPQEPQSPSALRENVAWNCAKTQWSWPSQISNQSGALALPEAATIGIPRLLQGNAPIRAPRGRSSFFALKGLFAGNFQIPQLVVQILNSRVGDFGVSEIQCLQIRQTLKMRQPGVGGKGVDKRQ